MPDETRTSPADPADPPDVAKSSTADVSAASQSTDSAGHQLLPHGLEVAPAVPGYELLDEIGRGGMGVVYRARDVALDRDVAVKLLSGRFEAGSAAARRFVDEARITSQLQHPGIPAVHQAGTLADGRPFLAMKLVKGQTLADQLAERADAGRDRGRFVAAFEGLCQAVGYAHAHGVIHRDLKPGNVMVGAFGEVQVMDWGLAKVLGRRGPRQSEGDPEATTGTAIRSARDAGLETQAGSLLGTPAFMPPEQAIGAVDQIDEQSDVFGLGAMLCVVLTGRPPYVGADAESTRQLAARARLGEALGRLDGCGADPALVSLCKRCLSPEKADRPRDAGQVAGAVRALRAEVEDRARRAEVVAATERARRRVLGWAAAAVAGVLAAGAGVSTWQALRATRAEGETATQLGLTQEAEARAREEARNARAAGALANDAAALALRREKDEQKARVVAEGVAVFMQEVFAQTSPEGQATPVRLVNPTITVREAMDYATRQAEGRFGDRPEVEAALRHTIGHTYLQLAAYPEALAQLDRALAIREEVLGPDHLDTLMTVNSLAILHRERGSPRAEPLLKRALAGFERVYGPDHPSTLNIVNGLGLILQGRGDYKAAEALFRRAIAGQEKGLPPDAPSTLVSVTNLGNLMAARGDYAAAGTLLGRALAGFEKAHGPDHPHTLVTLTALADLHERKREYETARGMYERALAGLERGLGPDHPSTINCVNSLAILWHEKRDYAAAGPLLKRALAGFEKNYGPDHHQTLTAVNNLAALYFATEDFRAAAPLYKRALAARERADGPDHPSTLAVVNNLALLSEALGDTTTAEGLYRRALAGWEKVHGPDHPTTLAIASNLADLYYSTRRNAQAVPLFERAVRGYGKRPEMATAVLVIRADLGLALLGLGKAAEAEPHLLAGYNALTRSKSPHPAIRNRHRWVTAGLVEVYDATNQPAKAKEWRATLAKLPPEMVSLPRVAK